MRAAFFGLAASVASHAAFAQPIEASLPATAEARAEHRDCIVRNARLMAQLSASREVVRTREMLRIDRAQGRGTSFSEGELDRTWKYYKSQGGAAATPDEVRVPDDPCAASADKVRQQMATANAQYRECAAAHPAEIRLSQAANRVIQARQWLAGAERVEEERRRNPNLDTRGSGEWAALARIEPGKMRQDLELRFAEYRSVGGPASRIEDVTPVPDPCVPQQREPGPSPVRRQMIVIPERR
jgi:hypothetical protein